MSLVPHVVGSTTYYACGECGSCPCPEHHMLGDHKPDCSHAIPECWLNEDCAMFGPGKFMMCSRCQYPPCRTAPEEKSEAALIPPRLE